MMKFTPGPWRIDKMNAAGIEVVGANGDLVHIVDYGDIPSEFDCGRRDQIINTEIANAFIIAAAPEMYEVLTSIENDTGQVPEWLWNKIQEVLQKARGKK